jgi:Holliday junction DNA helicase RuvA
VIGRLRGALVELKPDRLTVETSGGVGYEVFVPPRVLMELPTVGSQVLLHVHTQVREDAITLYGFLSADERQVFRVVQGVSGIGPKIALAVVGTLEPEALAGAIAREDIPALTRIPGLGKKTAARLCLELKDKLASLAEPAGPVAAAEPGAAEDAEAALAALGYSGREIARALKAAAAKPDDTVQAILRRALKALSPG